MTSHLSPSSACLTPTLQWRLYLFLLLFQALCYRLHQELYSVPIKTPIRFPARKTRTGTHAFISARPPRTSDIRSHRSVILSAERY
ncbi:hypothetical protein BDV95DRAFT_564517 [Massariosphaeria phaeospora]|uniref:Uncharacterized protein n=1 Tax=Massariosphaeria phaeospora TaxID=100035 RepID=A0A7C8IDG6_9PLEO|nr:hypothetical protein BDV95DRAFT_564517 [Massariosphaeria phaeospora]